MSREVGAQGQKGDQKSTGGEPPSSGAGLSAAEAFELRLPDYEDSAAPRETNERDLVHLEEEIRLSDEASGCRKLAAYEAGRLLNHLTFHLTQGLFGSKDHIQKAKKVAEQLGRRAMGFKGPLSERKGIQELITNGVREMFSAWDKSMFSAWDNSEEVSWSNQFWELIISNYEKPGWLAGWFADYFRPFEKKLQDIENAILESLTREERLAFYLGQVVDQGIRPRFREERFISYRSWGGAKIVQFFRSQEAGDVPPDTDWREDLRCAAGHLGIHLPHALVPERTGSPPPDYLAIVQRLDEFIRPALLGRPLASSVSAVEAVDPAEYKRLLKIKEAIDPDETYIGKSVALLRVFETIQQANETGKMITILGPSGAGKTVLAELIHRHSSRKENKFKRCQASDTKAADSVIVRGNWNGIGANSGLHGVSSKGRKGFLEEFAGGTIFLDEIHELHQDFQTLLLDIIDGQEMHSAAGESHSFKPDVRLLLASNKELREEAKAGRFKSDLLRRINENCVIRIPPLADRKKDIFLFVRKEFPDRSIKIDMRVYLTLLRHDWPGNVGELLGVLGKAKAKMARSKQFTLEHLELESQDDLVEQIRRMNGDEAERAVLDFLAHILPHQGFQSGGGLQQKMAEVLGYSEATVSRLVKKHQPFARP
jgi:DNA-binding NtrC family response regulator